MSKESEFNNEKFIYQYPLTITRHIVNLDSPISDPSNYRELTDLLIRAESNESIIFNIVSPGGRVDTTSQIISMLLNTEATTKAIIFHAASAASLIALSCDQIQVALTGTMMIHNSSMGAEGKTSDVLNFSSHIDRVTRDLFRLVYAGFLTEKELEEVLIGKEYYFDAKQIEKRLKKFIPIRMREKEKK